MNDIGVFFISVFVENEVPIKLEKINIVDKQPSGKKKRFHAVIILIKSVGKTEE